MPATEHKTRQDTRTRPRKMMGRTDLRWTVCRQQRQHDGPPRGEDCCECFGTMLNTYPNLEDACQRQQMCGPQFPSIFVSEEEAADAEVRLLGWTGDQEGPQETPGTTRDHKGPLGTTYPGRKMSRPPFLLLTCLALLCVSNIALHIKSFFYQGNLVRQ